MTSKDLRAKRAKLIEDARSLYNVAVTAGAPSAEDNAKFEAMMAEADAMKVTIDNVERADDAHRAQLEQFRAAGQLRGTDPDQERARFVAEEAAFGTWMRRGPNVLNEEQRAIFANRFEAPTNGSSDAPAGWRLEPFRAAMGTTPDTAGGYTVPQGFYAQLNDALLAYGGMTEAAFVFDTTSGNAMQLPTDNDTSNKGAILGENVQVSTQDVAFGSVTMNAYTYTSKLVLVSNQLLQDSAFNLDAFLSGKLGTRLARILNDHFTTGTGASQPTGVVTAATLGYTAGGTSSSGSTATVSYDDLVELEHSVDPAYRMGARYMMHDTTLKIIKKLKDGIGRPLWMAGLAVKEPDTINNYPYSINQSMAAPAASAKSMLFGNFSNYYVRRVAGTQVLRLTERYADYNQVGFLAFQRWDGQLIDAGTHPVKYLIQSAT